jgi:geranylgeranyl pyrophosphate synthase
MRRRPSWRGTKLIGLIASAAGTPNGMVAGQQLDLDAEGENLTIDEIERIHRSKTGALIIVSAMAGALIGKASNDELTAVEQYAQNLGLLFQVTDDLLDITAATESLGKTAGKDISSEKATYPKLLGIDATAKLANELSDKACRALSALQRDTTILKKLAEMLLNRKR